MKSRFTVILFLASFICNAQLTGKIISVADGDTFTMLVNEKQVRIRLHGIDCPEKSQNFGQVAKEFTSGYVFGKIVSVKEMDIDRYGRTIGIVTVNSVNVNEKLLEAGLAWHYKVYDKNPMWAKMELKARKDKRGLWKQFNVVAPWEYRRAKTENSEK